MAGNVWNLEPAHPADLLRRARRLEGFGWQLVSTKADEYEPVEGSDLFRRLPGRVSLRREWRGQPVRAHGETLEAAITEAEQLQHAIFPFPDRLLSTGVPVSTSRES